MTEVEAALKPQHTHIHVSEGSWDFLVRTASAYSWIRTFNSQTVAGPPAFYFGRFVEALSYLQYTDARPDTLHGTRVWCTGEPAVRRTVTISKAAVLGFMQHAVLLRVYPREAQMAALNEHTPLDSDDAAYAQAMTSPNTTPVSYVSVVLEAIGARFLQPYPTWPTAPPNLWSEKKPRHRNSNAGDDLILRTGYY